MCMGEWDQWAWRSEGHSELSQTLVHFLLHEGFIPLLSDLAVTPIPTSQGCWTGFGDNK